MTVLVLMFSFIMLLAVGVMIYAAFPDRGRDVPRAHWLGVLVSLPVIWVQRLTHHDEHTLRR